MPRLTPFLFGAIMFLFLLWLGVFDFSPNTRFLLYSIVNLNRANCPSLRRRRLPPLSLSLAPNPPPSSPRDPSYSLTCLSSLTFHHAPFLQGIYPSSTLGCFSIFCQGVGCNSPFLLSSSLLFGFFSSSLWEAICQNEMAPGSEGASLKAPPLVTDYFLPLIPIPPSLFASPKARLFPTFHPFTPFVWQLWKTSKPRGVTRLVARARSPDSPLLPVPIYP